MENLISRVKTSHQSRQSTKSAAERLVDICFKPQDFDTDYNRSANVSVNYRALFKDVLNCNDIVNKLEGYVSTANSMRARGINPRKKIPFNFMFKGPPSELTVFVYLIISRTPTSSVGPPSLSHSIHT